MSRIRCCAARGRSRVPRSCRGQPAQRAKSRGPKTAEGKARSAQNALKHGMRAAKHIVLPDEDAGEFAHPPDGAVRGARSRRRAPDGARAARRGRGLALARADRMEAELFEERRWDDGDLGLALIRDGNGPAASRR